MEEEERKVDYPNETEDSESVEEDSDVSNVFFLMKDFFSTKNSKNVSKVVSESPKSRKIVFCKFRKLFGTSERLHSRFGPTSSMPAFLVFSVILNYNFAKIRISYIATSRKIYIFIQVALWNFPVPGSGLQRMYKVPHTFESIEERLRPTIIANISFPTKKKHEKTRLVEFR